MTRKRYCECGGELRRLFARPRRNGVHKVITTNFWWCSKCGKRDEKHSAEWKYCEKCGNKLYRLSTWIWNAEEQKKEGVTTDLLWCPECDLKYHEADLKVIQPILPFCLCGCGERVKKLGNKYVYGHNHRVESPLKGRNTGKTYEELYGVERAKVVKVKIAKAGKGRKYPKERGIRIAEKLRGRKSSDETKKKISAIRKGKTFEEIFGVEKAKEIKLKMSATMMGRKPPHAGKTWEEFFGEERAKELKAKVSALHKGKPHILSEEGRARVREGIRNRPYKKPYNKGKKIEEVFGSEKANAIKRKISEKKKGRKHTEETRKRMSEAHKNHIFSDEHRRKISENNAMNDPEKRRKVSEALKGRQFTEETKRKMSKSREGMKLSEENCKNISKGIKRLWENPEYKAKMVKIRKEFWKQKDYASMMIKAFHFKPNKPEKMLNLLLSQILPREYHLNVHGDYIVGGKIPDFVNINGQNKLIEFYGNYWHTEEEAQERIAYFKKCGYGTLIIWESELENINNVVTKILEFHNLTI